ncbi:alpha/beta hydrolase [Nocardioidaceae bacterium]|nr:alpha/beta hydrolase [Nocardioidaceae bacterium]
MAVGLSLALGVAGLAGTPATAAPVVPAQPVVQQAAYTPPPIDWGRCTDEFLSFIGIECGFLVVPLDHDDPTGRTIELAVSRLEHTSAPSRYKGVMLTNPGGPGGSGLSLPIIGTSVPFRAGSEWDWIGMDPRGVSGSVPRLRCDPSYSEAPRPSYEPSLDGEAARWIARAQGYAQACGDAPASGLLEHLRTEDVVADLDLLRVALGKEQVGFYGYSYGSYLGQVYATQHPDRVSRLVLDANVDADKVWYDASLEQSRAFDRSLQAFFAFAGRYDRAFGLGKGRRAVERTYLRLRERLDRRPVKGIGAAEFVDAVQVTAYTTQLWPLVASALARLDDRGRVGRLRWFTPRPGPRSDNAYASYLGTFCTDALFPTELRTWTDDAMANAEVAPLSTWGSTWANLPCRTWPVAAEPPVEVDGSTLDVPVLLAGTTGDAPTPFAWSRATRERFPTASLVAGVGGRDHGFSLQGNRCVDETVARYLRRGVVPPRLADGMFDKTCRVQRPTLDFFFGPTFFREAPAGARARAGSAGSGREEIELTRRQQVEFLLDRAAIPGRG